VGVLLVGRLDAAAVGMLPTGFLATDAALLVTGAALGFAGAAASRAPGGVLTALGAAAALWSGWPLLAAAPPGATTVALVIVLLAGVAALALGRVTSIQLPSPSSGPWSVGAVAALVTGTAVAAVGPNIGVVLAAILVAALSGYLLQRLAGGPQLPVVPVVFLLLVAPAWWLMATIAGPERLAMRSLADLPFSSAAEQLLAALVLPAGWALSGLWPFHRYERGVLLAPAGALLIGRVVLSALPYGLEHWRPLAVPLVVVGLWHAALGRRWPAVGVAAAWIGLVGGGPVGEWAAALALTGSVTLEVVRCGPRVASGELVADLGWVMIGVGALLAAERGLGTEVVYTVMGVLGAVAGVGRASAAQAITATAPSAMAPSS
jgi:hypothetical protein